MMLQSWMGSDFTNDDIVKESSIVDDYTHVIEGTETVEGNRVLPDQAHAEARGGSGVGRHCIFCPGSTTTCRYARSSTTSTG